jgi:hypothetical protein
MYKLITTGLIALDTLLPLGLPVQAQEVATTRDCTATIAAVQNRIEKGRDIYVTARSYNISADYPDHPRGRPYQHQFILNGNASKSIMNSSKFLESIATNIISNCNSVGLVSFAVYQTGWNSSIGLMPNGSLKFFECLHYELNLKPVWGQEVCD